MLEGAECLRRSDAGWQSVPNSRKICVFTRRATLEGAECLGCSDAGWQSVPNSRKRCVFTRRLKVPSVSDAVTLDGKVFQTAEKATQTRMLVTNVSIPNVTVSRSRAFSIYVCQQILVMHSCRCYETNDQQLIFFSYACHEPQLVSHETASSSAECSRDKPPFSFVRGQDSTM